MLALQHYIHFLFGNGSSKSFNLAKLLQENPYLARRVSNEANKSSGTIQIEQKDYTCFNSRLAFGGISIKYFKNDESIFLSCKKQYSWLKSTKRISFLVHLANSGYEKLLGSLSFSCSYMLQAESTMPVSELKKWGTSHKRCSPNHFCSFLL